MKVTFEIDTDKEGFDWTELNRIQQADDMAYSISLITDKVRSWYKYDERNEIPVEEIQDAIYDILNEHLNLEKLGYF